MIILAIDPGTTVSGWCLLSSGMLVGTGVEDNPTILERIQEVYHNNPGAHLAIEMIASFGMPVGAETFRTVWWTGRFAERWLSWSYRLPIEVFRKDVKLHLCGTHKAKDPNIRQSLIDRLGAPGTKKAPGGTFGVKSHAWSALAVAITANDQMALARAA